MKRKDMLTPVPKSKFLRVQCPECGNEQTVFSSVASVVKCTICGKELALPTGGKSKLLSDKVKEIA
ncbi:MAG TPA: 30S ribosomal protein S27e [Candidatus Methanomethylicus sp.]|jgi:small subunit ribosomal protein S27e|nr:30S ribosomal protein S27e [Candidatus Methanomethylicus sp.]HRR54329.1 30S ribosomal protein S27e [Candidatus Methanomethylicus sp.]